MGRFQGKRSILFASIAMDICWLQAWTVFLLNALFNYQVHLYFVLSLFLSGVLIHTICHSHRFYRLLVIVLNGFAFVTVLMTATHWFVLHLNPSSAAAGIWQLLNRPKSVQDWFLMAILALIALLIWHRAAVHIKKPTSLNNIYLRFDLGIGAIFVLLLVKLLLYARFDLSFSQPRLETLFLPLLLFGLMSITLLLNSQTGIRQYASGFQKIGIALSFTVAVLSLGFGLISLFRDQLVTTAEVLSSAAKKGGSPLLNAFVWLARLLWGPRKSLESATPSSANRQNLNIINSSADQGSSFIYQIIQWGLIILGIVAVVAVSILILRLLIQYLFTKVGAKTSFQFRLFNLNWVKWFTRILSQIGKSLITRFSYRGTAIAVYKTFLAWGRRSGFKPARSETIIEYSDRIIQFYPDLRNEVQSIAQLLQEAFYGEIALDRNQLIMARQAGKAMGHPKFWLKRIKTWIFSPEI